MGKKGLRAATREKEISVLDPSPQRMTSDLSPQRMRSKVKKTAKKSHPLRARKLLLTPQLKVAGDDRTKGPFNSAIISSQ